MKGEWVDGTPIGPLIIYYSNGNVYEGEVYNLRSHGRGKLISKNHTYVGEFSYGELHGEGVIYDKKGKKVREGEWKRGKYIGWYIYYNQRYVAFIWRSHGKAVMTSQMTFEKYHIWNHNIVLFK